LKEEKLREIAALAEKVGHVLIATADSEGQPHIAAARKLTITAEGSVELREWFCPGTVANLESNSRMSLVVWDMAKDTGHQLSGTVVEMRDVDVLNGYAPQIERDKIIPQVERRLVISVKKITEFKCAPHSDVEE
jgi:uncharacterized protein